MAQCKVINKNSLEHREKFRDDLIIIPPGDHVLMDYEDAVQFKGQYFPRKMNADGTPDVAGFKMIQIEPLNSEAVVTKPTFICQLDGREFATEAELNAHLETLKALVYKDEALDKELQMEKKAKKQKEMNL